MLIVNRRFLLRPQN